MLPKNTHRQRRMDRLKVFADEAPESMLANVLTTWRERADLQGGTLLKGQRELPPITSDEKVENVGVQ